jgi:hypothetical protein
MSTADGPCRSDVFDQLPDDAVRERHLVTLVDIARAVEHWARVSPKWYPTGGSSTPRAYPGQCRPHELAQAIFMESNAELVFVGKCKDCTCGVIEHAYSSTLEPWYDSDSLARKNFKTKLSDDGLFATWACPACDGTAEKRAPVAVLLSDAADGDGVARDTLLAHADQLLADGNPLGELLSWTLLLWMREPADLRHADEAVRWLEWLTAQHELLRNRKVHTVMLDGHVYSVPASNMTMSEIAAALNEQGGPATFTTSESGNSVITTIRHGATSSTLIVASDVSALDLRVLGWVRVASETAHATRDRLPIAPPSPVA